MSIFFAQFKLCINKALQYRVSYILSVITSIFWGLMSVFIISTFYGTGNELTNLKEAVSYVWLGRMFSMLLAPLATINIGDMVLDGSIAFELSKPVNCYRYWCSKILSERLSKMCFSAPIVLVVSVCLPDGINLHAPASFDRFILFFISMFFSIVIIISYELIIESLSFYSVSFNGIAGIISQLFYLLSGSTIPLFFFSPVLQQIIKLLPFAAVLDAPLSIYIGDGDIETVLFILTKQLIWAIIFWLLGSKLVNKLIKRVEVCGG